MSLDTLTGMSGWAVLPANGLVFILFEKYLSIEKITNMDRHPGANKYVSVIIPLTTHIRVRRFQSRWNVPCTQSVVCAMAYVKRINVYCPLTIDPHHLRGSQEV